MSDVDVDNSQCVNGTWQYHDDDDDDNDDYDDDGDNNEDDNDDNDEDVDMHRQSECAQLVGKTLARSLHALLIKSSFVSLTPSKLCV